MIHMFEKFFMNRFAMVKIIEFWIEENNILSEIKVKTGFKYVIR